MNTFRIATACAVAALMASSCFGQSSIQVFQAETPAAPAELPGPAFPKAPIPVCKATELAPTTLRRLTKYEYNRTASDLVGAPIDPARTLADDSSHFGFTNNADGQTLDPSIFDRYESAASEVAVLLAKKRTPCDVAANGAEACARAMLVPLAAKVWRRPVGTGELDAHVNVVTASVAAGDTFDEGLTLAVQALVLSPNFLFRVEQDPAIKTGEPTRVSDHALAARLSYFLWSSMPDDALRAAADTGQLQTAEGITAQVKRMLQDPRSSALTEKFGNEWLEVSKASSIAPTPTLFPGVDAALKDAMRKETELVFDEFLRADHSYRTLFTAPFTYVDDRLAVHYGLPPVGPGAPKRVVVDGSKRGGILKQAGFLSITSAPNRTSIVKRGQWVLSRLLCEELAFPDNMAAELPKTPVAGTTLRAQLESHRSDPKCAACHARMDPIGFGLENYDAVGRWRETDNGVQVDTRGVLPPNLAFDGPDALAGLLAKDPRVSACAVKNMTTFALGRSLRDLDLCNVARTTYQFDEGGSRLSDLVVLIATSPAFTHRLPAKDSP